MEEKQKKGTLGKILAIVGILAAIGGAVVAVIHFWDDIKEKFSCKKTAVEDPEDFLEDGLDALEDVVEDVQDDMEDFVEFEEL